jgi:hypothetical protein
MWALSGVAVGALARLLPFGRDQSWLTEGLIALGTALLLGVIATILDFGGWNELDWRAGIFAGLGAFAAIGVLRLWRVAR